MNHTDACCSVSAGNDVKPSTFHQTNSSYDWDCQREPVDLSKPKIENEQPAKVSTLTQPSDTYSYSSENKNDITPCLTTPPAQDAQTNQFNVGPPNFIGDDLIIPFPELNTEGLEGLLENSDGKMLILSISPNGKSLCIPGKGEEFVEGSDVMSDNDDEPKAENTEAVQNNMRDVSGLKDMLISDTLYPNTASELSETPFTNTVSEISVIPFTNIASKVSEIPFASLANELTSPSRDIPTGCKSVHSPDKQSTTDDAGLDQSADFELIKKTLENIESDENINVDDIVDFLDQEQSDPTSNRGEQSETTYSPLKVKRKRTVSHRKRSNVINESTTDDERVSETKENIPISTKANKRTKGQVNKSLRKMNKERVVKKQSSINPLKISSTRRSLRLSRKKDEIVENKENIGARPRRKEIDKDSSGSGAAENPLDTSVPDHVKQSPRRNTSASDHAKQSPRRNTFASDHVQQSPRRNTSASDHVQQSPRRNTSATDHVQQSPRRKTSASNHVQQSPRRNTLAADRFKLSSRSPRRNAMNARPKSKERETTRHEQKLEEVRCLLKPFRLLLNIDNECISFLLAYEEANLLHQQNVVNLTFYMKFTHLGHV